MDKKVEAYRGSDPYIFVSYAHKNADIVHPFISVLQEKYNVWFDEGIHFGREWDDEIMTRIEQCNLFLFIVTKDSLVSSNCKDELAQARELKKEFINILVERSLDNELPPYFKLRYSRFQKCYLDSYDSLEAAVNSLGEKCDAFSSVKKGTELLQKHNNAVNMSKEQPTFENNNTRIELRKQLDHLYSTCIDYKNALNCGDNKKYHVVLNSLVQQLHDLYNFFEKNRLVETNLAQMAFAICDKWNEFIPHYNAFSNNPDRSSEAAQKEGTVLTRLFSEFVELIATTRNKL